LGLVDRGGVRLDVIVWNADTVGDANLSERRSVIED
jgi:hypothetical protein